MRFEWNPKAPHGGCELTAHTDDYDGHPPVTSLRLEYSPRYTTTPRVAAAAVLAFRPYLSGVVAFPAPVSPEFASAVEDVLAPVTAFPQPVDLYPKPIPTGAGSVMMRFDDVTEDGDRRADTPELLLTSVGESFGHTITGDRVVVSTNAARLVPRVGSRLRRSLPYLAAATLLAEDFSWQSLQLPGIDKDPDNGLTAPVRALLAATGLLLAEPTSLANASRG